MRARARARYSGYLQEVSLLTLEKTSMFHKVLKVINISAPQLEFAPTSHSSITEHAISAKVAVPVLVLIRYLSTRQCYEFQSCQTFQTTVGVSQVHLEDCRGVACRLFAPHVLFLMNFTSHQVVARNYANTGAASQSA